MLTASSPMASHRPAVTGGYRLGATPLRRLEVLGAEARAAGSRRRAEDEFVDGTRAGERVTVFVVPDAVVADEGGEDIAESLISAQRTERLDCDRTGVGRSRYGRRMDCPNSMM